MRTYKRGLLLLLVAVTVVISTTIATLYGQSQISDKTDSPNSQRPTAELESRVPVVDFEAPEPGDPEKRAQRRKKNARYDKNHLVRKDDISGSATESAFFSEWDLGLPPLPTAQSEVIIIGEVTEAQAHLSNDKTGIYSEFGVRIEKVLKNGSPTSLNDGSQVHLERMGGAVRYPNGRKYLYRVAGQNMPRVGLRYAFFLKTTEGEQSFKIITAYELRGGKVFPLDSADQFDAYKGVEQGGFLEALKNAAVRP